MYFRTNPEIYYDYNAVDNRLFICNLISKKEYTFSGVEANIIMLLLESTPRRDLVGKYDQTVIDRIASMLCSERIGEFYKEKVYVERISTVDEKALKNEKFRELQLKRLSLGITSKCNFDCKFCTLDNTAYRTCGCKRWGIDDIMTLKDYENVIDSAIMLGLNRVDFIGGEPFLRKDILFPLLDKLNKANISVYIYTNASLIDEETGTFLCNKNVHLCLQIFGCNDLTYGNITQRPQNAFDLVLRGFDILRKYNIRRTVQIVVSSLNEDSIGRIKDYFCGEAIEEIYIFPTNQYYSKRYLTNMLDPQTRRISVDLFTYQLSKEFNTCLFAHLFVSSDGEIYPCVMLRESLGNILRTELWRVFYNGSHKKYWHLSKSKLNHCKDCEQKLVCFDCRALEISGTLDPTGMKFCKLINNN